ARGGPGVSGSRWPTLEGRASPVPPESVDSPTADSREPTGESTPASPRRGTVAPADGRPRGTTSAVPAEHGLGCHEESDVGCRFDGVDPFLRSGRAIR